MFQKYEKRPFNTDININSSNIDDQKNFLRIE